MDLLQNIHGHNDLLKLTEEQRLTLCQQIREFLVAKVSKTGGHLASNLGVVELTVALETVFDTAKDRLVFDVGHQSYVHKLLTDRQTGFDSLRQFGGMAGFPKPSESNTDAFVAGHASSSVSIALGMARARTLSGDNYNVIAVLGDGAATGGIAYEGLNDAAVSKEPLIVILNDNAMSIDHNVGGMASHLSGLRTKEKYLGMKQKYKTAMSKIPGGGGIVRVTRGIKDSLHRMLIPTTLFESMGFTYLGPVDGHDTENLITLLRIAKDMRRPVVLHVMTKKGKGYAPAEEHPKLFHGVGTFDPVSGSVPEKARTTFSDVFGKTMLDIARENERVCAITAAMPGGTGLLDFKKQFPKRMFDVGIAEEHAVSMAGGLAKQGMVPVVAIYSTFLQRSYDMILQDICLQKLHVVLAVDRAGLVGEDGETHHGVFDVGFLRQMPGMTVLCPGNTEQLRDMLNWAVNVYDGPVAIRYPRGEGTEKFTGNWSVSDAITCHGSGKQFAIITYGNLLENALGAASILRKTGIDITVIQMNRLHPIPTEELKTALLGIAHAVILEDTCGISGVHTSIMWEMMQENVCCRFTNLDLGSDFTTHGSISQLHKHYGLDAESVAQHIREVLKVEN